MTSRFQRGSGLYKCRICDKQTRETGHSESSVGMCRICYEAAGYGNELEDHSEDFAEIIGDNPWTYMEEPKCSTVQEVEERFRAAVHQLSAAGKWHGCTFIEEESDAKE